MMIKTGVSEDQDKKFGYKLAMASGGLCSKQRKTKVDMGMVVLFSKPFLFYGVCYISNARRA